MKIPIIGDIVKGVTSAYGKRQDRKAREVEAVASVRAQLSSDNKEITISKDTAEALVRKAAVQGLDKSLKDELVTITICLFFFIVPSVYAAVDALFGTQMLTAHLQVFDLLLGIETEDNALGIVFVGVMLTAVGITGIRSFFR